MIKKIKSITLAILVAVQMFAVCIESQAVERVYILPSTTREKAPENNMFQLKGSQDKYILLDNTGDLLVSKKGNIVLEDSVAQKIRIRLLWFEKEWRWNREEGLPYMDGLLVKNPDTDYFENLVRRKIFEVPEVTEVREVSITYDSRDRNAVLRYVALTDLEIIKEEVRIRCQIME